MRARLGLLVAAALVPAAPAAAHSGHGPVAVQANGNPLQGGLAFAPAGVSIQAGDSVEWTNTDRLVEHAPAEEAGLWSDSMRPQEKRLRVFEAGTHVYVCSIHPSMRGSVAVAPRAFVDVRTEAYTVVKTVRRRGKKRRVKLRGLRERHTAVVQWAAAAPGPNLAFDVERRRPGGAWTALARATQGTGLEFPAGARGTTWELRVRLRAADDGSRATGWSPIAGLTS